MGFCEFQAVKFSQSREIHRCTRKRQGCTRNRPTSGRGSPPDRSIPLCACGTLRTADWYNERLNLCGGERAYRMKVDLGQNVRLVVSLWRFVVSSFRHVASSFCYGVSSFRHADFWSRLGELPVRFVGWSAVSFRRFVVSSCRFVMSFRRFDSSTQRGYNSTYITWSVYLTPCTYTWRIYS